MSALWRTRSRYLLISVLVFLLDQLTKKIVTQAMVPHQAIDVAEDFLTITYIHNRGAVFGIGSSFATPYLSWLLSLLSILSLGIILFYFLRVTVANPKLYIGLALVLGGAMGNLFDRLRSGYVVDFVDLHWFTHHWPTFNFADFSICLGVGLLLLSMSSATEHAAAAESVDPVNHEDAKPI